jgi:hypothetical protein
MFSAGEHRDSLNTVDYGDHRAPDLVHAPGTRRSTDGRLQVDQVDEQVHDLVHPLCWTTARPVSRQWIEDLTKDFDSRHFEREMLQAPISQCPDGHALTGKPQDVLRRTR